MTDNNQTTTNNEDEDSGWKDCSGGEISGMVSRLARRRKLAASAKMSIAALGLLIGAGVWQIIPASPQQTVRPDGDYEFGSICCSDVMGYAAAFHKGELDTEKTAQIRKHVSECPHCGPAFKKLASEPHTAIDGNPAGWRVVTLAKTTLIPGR